MSYKNSTAKETGKSTESTVDKFFIENGYNCVKPSGKDIGIDRIVTSDKYPGVEVKIQIKGRRVEETPRWFQFKVNSSKIRDAIASGKDLNELWKERIYMNDFWVLVSIPKNEIWVFPSVVIHEIADINYHKYKGRRDNNFNEVFTDKNGKIESKQKELNLNNMDEDGVVLYERFAAYKHNLSCIEDFFREQSTSK